MAKIKRNGLDRNYGASRSMTDEKIAEENRRYDRQIGKPNNPSAYHPVLNGGFLMPFGKYQGNELSSIPVDYLVWLITNDIGSRQDMDRIDRYLMSCHTKAHAVAHRLK